MVIVDSTLALTLDRDTWQPLHAMAQLKGSDDVLHYSFILAVSLAGALIQTSARFPLLSALCVQPVHAPKEEWLQARVVGNERGRAEVEWLEPHVRVLQVLLWLQNEASPQVGAPAENLP